MINYKCSILNLSCKIPLAELHNVVLLHFEALCLLCDVELQTHQLNYIRRFQWNDGVYLRNECQHEEFASTSSKADGNITYQSWYVYGYYRV